MTVCGIYAIKNTVNGKLYIGQSLDVLQRWRQHKHRLDEGTHLNAHLQAAWQMHGANSFLFQVLRVCEPDALGTTEEAVLAAVSPDLRYNIGPAGDNPTRGLKHGESVRANMSRAKGGRPVVATNVETGEERRFAHLKQAVDILGLSYAHAWEACNGKGGRPTVKGWRFRHDSDYVPPAPKEKSPRKRLDRRSREIVGTHVDTGEEIRFARVAAVRERGFMRESVIKCLAGQMNTHGGYRWRYADGLPHGTLDDAWKAKLRQPRKHGNSASRPIVGTHVVTGEVVRFSYLAEAARAVGVSGPALNRMIAGKSKSAGGYVWKYE
jgi:hypothetical protein